MKRNTLYGIAAVLITAFIFYNSSQDAVNSSSASEGFVKFAESVLGWLHITIFDGILVWIVRKAAHIIEFFMQSFCTANALGGKYRKRIVYILFFGLLTACIDEFIQLFSLGRSSEIKDVFIDFFGTIMGMIIGAVIYKLKRRRKC